MRSQIWFRSSAAVIAIGGMLALGACGSSDPAATAEELDLAPLELTEEEATELTELYEAAIDSGNTDVTIYAGHHDEFIAIYDAFEARFPGLTVVPETFVGASLQTTLEAEKETGRHVVDVISNPNADRYADQGFAEKFTPATYTAPEWAEGRIHPDQYEDPDGYYHSPWALLFSLGYNTDMIDESELPSNWPEIADPTWADKVTFMTPSVPGGMQTVLSILLQSDVVDEEWLRTVAAQSSIVAQDQLSLQAVSAGEYPIDLTSAATSIRKAVDSGAPVALHLMENPVIATEKWMPAANSPNPDAGRLFLSYLFTLEAQEKVLEAGNFPLNPHESLEPAHGWPALQDMDFVPLPSQSDMRDEIASNQELFLEITAQ